MIRVPISSDRVQNNTWRVDRLFNVTSVLRSRRSALTNVLVGQGRVNMSHATGLYSRTTEEKLVRREAG